LRWVCPGLGPRLVTLWLHHGSGGGSKVSAPLTKLENLLPYWDADIFMIGHMTKKAAAPISRIAPMWRGKLPVLVEETIHLVGTGGWLKGYAERSRAGTIPRGGYVEQRMLNPVQLGAPIVTIKPKILDKSTTVPNTGGFTRKSWKQRQRRSRIWTPEITVE